MSETPIFDEIEKPTPIYGNITGDNKVITPAPSKKPQPKVVAATVGGAVGAALSTVIIWVAETVSKIDIPTEVEGASVILITAGLTFAAGYFKKN